MPGPPSPPERVHGSVGTSQSVDGRWPPRGDEEKCSQAELREARVPKDHSKRRNPGLLMHTRTRAVSHRCLRPPTPLMQTRCRCFRARSTLRPPRFGTWPLRTPSTSTRSTAARRSSSTPCRCETSLASRFPLAALTRCWRIAQDAQASLRSEIDMGVDPQPYSHTVHEARSRSLLVGLRAGLMSEHVGKMLQSLDESSQRAPS